MSDRLKQLRDAIAAAPSMRPACERWVALLDAEIAEREAPPPVLEGALAELRRTLFEEIDLAKGTRPFFPETRVDQFLLALQSELRTLALRGARPATRAEWLVVALDLAQDEGEVSEGLAKAVAGMLPALVGHESVRDALVSLPMVGEWHLIEEEVWQRVSLAGEDVAHASEDGVAPAYPAHWRIASMREWTFNRAPTLAAAMLAADAALRAEGRILLGGLPPEVALEGATVTATVDDDGRLVPADGGEPEVERRPEVDEEEPVTPPEEAQPDASWLRLVSVTEGEPDNVWVYEGARVEAVTARMMLWILARDPRARFETVRVATEPEAMHITVTTTVRLAGTMEEP